MPAPPARRTQQERRATTEAALLSAAAELVVESGVRSLTLARVGERAGYSRGIVTHQFGSKQALLEVLARTAQSQFAPQVDHLPPGLEQLLLLIDRYVVSITADGGHGRAFLLLWAEAATLPELAPILRERDDAFRAHLAAQVRAGIAGGNVTADVDPSSASVALLGQLRGIGLQWILDRDAVDVDRVRATVTTQWRRALTP